MNVISEATLAKRKSKSAGKADLLETDSFEDPKQKLLQIFKKDGVSDEDELSYVKILIIVTLVLGVVIICLGLYTLTLVISISEHLNNGFVRVKEF